MSDIGARGLRSAPAYVVLAIALLVAQSAPEEKTLMIKLIVNLIRDEA